MTESKKLLVIDDEPTLLKIMGRFLSKLKVDAELAENGQAGLEKLRSSPKDFKGVVVDYSLPDISCGELVGEIRKVNAEIKIILSTGFATDELHDEIQFDAALQKPFSFGDFKSLIDTYFSNLVINPL